jgi:ABC-2 type transport system permease protein
MSLRRTWAIARKEFLHVFRDPRSLAMALAMPLMLLLIFGYALTLDVDRVPLVVWDQSETSASRDFISQFSGSRYFAVRRHVRNYRELERAMDTREALLGLVVPRGFAEEVAAGRPASAQLIVDGSDANTATIATGYADAVAQTYSQVVLTRTLRRTGERPPTPPLELRPRAWFNDDMQSRNFLVPGLIAVIMMILAGLLTSQTVAREWERGTMEQLISTPVRGSELVAGKLIPYFAIGMLDVLLAVLMGEFLFQVPLRGSLALLFSTAAVFLLGSLAMGMVISILTKNQLMANQLAMMATFVPSFLLSGLMFAIANMPHALQGITLLVPARYFVTLMRGIYLKGVGLEVLGLEALLLSAFTVGMVALANVKFRKKLTER